MHKLCFGGPFPGRLPSRLGTVLGGLDDLLPAAEAGSGAAREMRGRIGILPDLPDHLRRDLGL